MRIPLIRTLMLFAGAPALIATPAAAQPVPDVSSFDTTFRPIRVVKIADGLESPWSLVFLPSGDMLVTERPGRLRLIHDGKLEAEPVGGVPEVRYKLHGGLMDIALHPDFAANGLVYLTYSKTVFRDDKEGGSTAVFRARFDGKNLIDGRDIFVADAWSALDVNFGSRVIFDRAGHLFVSVGDRGPNGEPFAQDLSVHNGKILRLNDDGSVPADNPFVGKAGARAEIYSYGHRNPQGFTIHPETGALWASEHGPLGGDEVNIIAPGNNYGWPIVSYGRKYNGDLITDQPWREGMEPPRYYWVPSIGISGLLFYTGDAFPEWQGELFVTGMSGMLIQRVRQQGRGTHERESMLTALRQQIRDIDQGPDGLLYVVTRQDARMHENSGTVLRIEPAGPAWEQ